MLSDEECCVIAKTFLNESEFKLVEWKLLNTSGVKPGFLGIPTNLFIKVMLNEGKEERSLQFFVKHVPNNNKELENLVRELRVFYKESEIYANILSKLEPFGTGKLFPRFFYARSDEIIVLEDLGLLGFKSKSHYDVMDYDHCALAIQALAKLHAASIIYEEQNQVNIGKLFPHLLFETLFTKDPTKTSHMHVKVSINALNYVLEKQFKNISSDMKKKISELLSSIFQRVSPSKTRRNVFTHGDLWTNNVMFHYDSDGKVDNLRLIDLQLARYNVPAFDVLLFLYLSTSHHFRKENLDRLLENYYKHLKDILAEAEININQIITWKEFKASIEEELPAVLCITPIYLHYILLPPKIIEEMMSNAEEYERIVKVNRNELINKVMNTCKNYNDCISLCILELIEFVRKH